MEKYNEKTMSASKEDNKYNSKLINTINSNSDFHDFFWNVQWDNYKKANDNFWEELSEKAKELGFKGYQSLCQFFISGKIKTSAEPRTIEEKLEEINKEHYSHGTSLVKYKSILDKGVLCFRYLESLGRGRHGIWGITRSPDFVFLQQMTKKGLCSGENAGGDMTVCLSPRLNQEVVSNKEEAMYPGMIHPNDIISISLGDRILTKYYSEFSKEGSSSLHLSKDKQKEIEALVNVQNEYFDDAHKYGIPIIIDGRKIVTP